MPCSRRKGIMYVLSETKIRDDYEDCLPLLSCTVQLACAASPYHYQPAQGGGVRRFLFFSFCSFLSLYLCLFSCFFFFSLVFSTFLSSLTLITLTFSSSLIVERYLGRPGRVVSLEAQIQYFFSLLPFLSPFVLARSIHYSLSNCRWPAFETYSPRIIILCCLKSCLRRR